LKREAAAQQGSGFCELLEGIREDEARAQKIDQDLGERLIIPSSKGYELIWY
jgi:hypothetical protein